MTRVPTSRTVTGLAAVAVATAATLVLAACGTGEAEPDAASTAESVPPAGDFGDFAAPGVSGEIALVQDGVIQVQDSSSQTAVSYTADTVISVEQGGSLADVTVGSCVVVIEGDATTSVTVSSPVDGECLGGAGGGFPGGGFPDGAGLPSGAPTDGSFPGGAGGAPTDLPTDFPADGTGGFGGGGAFTVGVVTAVSGTEVTIETTGQDGSVSSETVDVADAAVTATVDGDDGDFAVGLCATAQGEADDAGGFAATSITVSEPGDDGCSATAGGFPGGPGGPGGPAQGTQG